MTSRSPAMTVRVDSSSHQLRIVDLARGIIQDHNQVIALAVLKPAMLAAINVQQHPRHGPSRSSSAMRSTFASLSDQASSLQCLLHPGVAQLDAVLLPQLFVEMSYVQVVIDLPIQAQHRLTSLERHPLRADHSLAPIRQAVVAVLLQPFPPAPHRALVDTQDLRCLPPGDLLRHGSQQHFLHLHHPLHLGTRIRSAGSQLPASRSSSAILKADNSCVNYGGQITY